MHASIKIQEKRKTMFQIMDFKGKSIIFCALAMNGNCSIWLILSVWFVSIQTKFDETFYEAFVVCARILVDLLGFLVFRIHRTADGVDEMMKWKQS